MNLKRHHVLYGILAVSLMLALVVFLTPASPSVSYTQGTAATTSAPLPAMRFEVVTTQAAQAQGLGGRSDVPENYGMLFVFPTDQRVGFWMKDMQVPIDIIWLSDTGAVLGIEDSVSPDTYPKAFYPPQPVKYVLETRAGEARRREWVTGSQVSLPPPYGSISGL